MAIGSCARPWWLGWSAMGVVAVATAGCGIDVGSKPAAVTTASAMTSPAPALAPQPWTLAELTYHPCSVLDSEDLARFVLDPVVRADTPPEGLSACSWFSIQTSLSGRFNIRFAPAKADLSDLSQRRVSDPLEQQVAIGGQRAVLKSEVRPDGRNGSCSVHVSVPSGGSFYLGIAAAGITSGVDWDVCAKTIDIATVISARLR
ncbi:DUF3558 family protein [Nocardia rosealba]|uniref:DUF3558 family protein n=1 Tax=Nocardia rosealba TaxID=2878563 RepID=UPI001CD9E7FE|nr:DUF3558 family protein [Nocardia rosealba]MCA2207840.1 DUF3558 family protein [Nocardia rosealba]